MMHWLVMLWSHFWMLIKYFLYLAHQIKTWILINSALNYFLAHRFWMEVESNPQSVVGVNTFSIYIHIKNWVWFGCSEGMYFYDLVFGVNMTHTHTNTHQHALSLSLTHTLSHTHTHTLSLTHTHTLSLTHAHTHTTPTHTTHHTQHTTHTHTLSLSHTHTHTHTLGLQSLQKQSWQLWPGIYKLTPNTSSVNWKQWPCEG